MCVWRHNQQFFTHKASLGPVMQIIENGLIRFGKRSFNVVNFQRPDWISGSFHATFKLARLVQIPNIHKRGELFFPFPNRPQIRCRWLVTSLFRAATTQALRHAHSNGVLVPEQALSQGAVETFNNGLVTVNVNSPAPNVSFVIFHFFCNSAHEFAPRVNLQQLRPFERRALVNSLKSQGNFISFSRSRVQPLCSGWPRRQR